MPFVPIRQQKQVAPITYSNRRRTLIAGFQCVVEIDKCREQMPRFKKKVTRYRAWSPIKFDQRCQITQKRIYAPEELQPWRHSFSMVSAKGSAPEATFVIDNNKKRFYRHERQQRQQIKPAVSKRHKNFLTTWLYTWCIEFELPRRQSNVQHFWWNPFFRVVLCERINMGTTLFAKRQWLKP